MLNYIIFDDQIKVWWAYQKLEKEDEYIVLLNEKEVGRGRATNFSFKNLTPNTAYKIGIKFGEKVIGADTLQTSKAKNRIDITKPPYNAVGDGKTLNTASIQRAIDDCGKDDCVYIPDGVYLSGALFLRSDTELLLSDNALLQGSTRVEDYPKIPSRFEGIEDECYSSLINVGVLDHTKGYTTKNVIIRGGKIFGGGKELRKNIIEREKIIFQELYRKKGASEAEINSNLVCNTLPGRKRGRCMQVSNTEGFILADCECGMAPSWNLHFIYSKDIVTCGCKLVSKGISNGDGWDPDSSKNCICFDTLFDTGDDCVAIKSGKNPEGNEIGRPCEDIKVFDCVSNGGWGIAIGSEMSGGVEDVALWNLDLKNARIGLNIKAPAERGGYVKNVSLQNSILPMVKISQESIYNPSTQDALNPSRIENITLRDLYLGGRDYFDKGRNNSFAISCIGKEKGLIENIDIGNITLERRAFTPTQEFYFKDVSGVTVKNIIAK